MNAPSPIPSRVRKLLPLLASDHDGEVVGTAHAITRTLAGAGLDWHALAAVVPVDEPKVEPTPQPEPAYDAEAYDRWRGRRAAWAEEQRQREQVGPRSYGDWRETWVRRHRRHRWFTEVQEARQRDQIRFCRRNAARMGPRERAFINDIAKIRDGLSLGQADWLADITDRLEQEGRTACH